MGMQFGHFPVPLDLTSKRRLVRCAKFPSDRPQYVGDKVAARTVLGPKPCSTQAPTVLDVDVLVPSVSMFPLGAGEPSRANPPKAADRPKRSRKVNVMEMSSSEALLTVKFHERRADAWLGLALACVLAAAVSCRHRSIEDPLTFVAA